MANVNISKVYLLSVPLENDYKNTLYFNSLESQQEYFQSRIVRRYTDFSYQRKDNKIRVPNIDAFGLNSSFDDLLNAGVNYVMYQNSAYSNKWFYAFIKDIQYVDDGRTDIIIETDVMQTWMFKYTVKPSFIEREHVDDDTIGKHTIPEGLETGEYTSKSSIVYEDLLDTCPVVAMTYDPIEDANAWGSFQGNRYDGLEYYIFKGTLADDYSASDQVTVIKNLLDKLAKDGKADAIVSVFMAPKKLVGWKKSSETTWHVMKGTGLTGSAKRALEDSTAEENTSYEPVKFSDLTVGKPTDIQGYKPRNNKLFTFPFNYMYVTNNNGGNVIYHYEDFADDVVTFKVKGVITPSCSIRAIPTNYKHIEENYNDGLNAGKFPLCAWMNDLYINWLTQNGINIGLQVISSGLQVLGGIGLMATGAGAMAGGSSIASGALGIAGAMGQVHSQSLVPPQAEGNINGADIGFSDNRNTFEVFRMQIREEYAKSIDDYFHMFGYKVNRVKVPNKAHRGRFWYTKTIDVNIDGAIPQNDLQIIKNCYNNGITFWRNASEIQNYDLDNNIV